MVEWSIVVWVFIALALTVGVVAITEVARLERKLLKLSESLRGHESHFERLENCLVGLEENLIARIGALSAAIHICKAGSASSAKKTKVRKTKKVRHAR